MAHESPSVDRKSNGKHPFYMQNLLPVVRASGQLFFSGQAYDLRDIPES